LPGKADWAVDLEGVRRRYGTETPELVTHGLSEAQTHRLPRSGGSTALWLKRSRVEDSAALDAEADRLEWLSATPVGCPEVVDRGPGWFVTTELTGRDAAQDWPAEVRAAVLDAMVEQLRQLHALDAARCPFPSGYPSFEPADRLVVTHGDYCCPNVFVDPATLRPTGVLDVGELGIGDPRIDLAAVMVTLAGGLNPQYGGRTAYEYVCRGYGAHPDDERTVELFRWYRSRG
jgi:kanamycin kinase/aminoglycoside 3'-phosphotransferase-2